MKIVATGILICLMAVQVYAQTYDAIIVGDAVRMREFPELSARILAILKGGTLVDLLDVTKERFRLNENYMYGYHWFHVSIRDGHEGWVYGEYVYLMSEDILPPDWTSNSESGVLIKHSYIDTYFGDKDILTKIFTVDEIKYKVNLGVEPSYPISDEQGLSGSTIHSLPFFYDIMAEKALPFIAYEEKPSKVEGLEKIKFFSPRHNAWFTKDGGCRVRLASDEGITERLASIHIVESEKFGNLLILKVTFNLQDGGGEYHLLLFPKKDHIEVECIYYTEEYMGEGIERGVNLLE
jgi:hypothetical protein